MLKAKYLVLLGLLVVAGVLASILFIFFPSLLDPKCTAILGARRKRCGYFYSCEYLQTTDVPSDDMVQYLANERSTRGLIFKKWIVCKTPNQTATPGFAFEQDPTAAIKECGETPSKRSSLRCFLLKNRSRGHGASRTLSRVFPNSRVRT